MALSKVLEPITIGSVTIKNRIVRTAHGEHLGAHYVSDEFIAYHTARARGEVGLSVLGVGEVANSTFGGGAIYNDDVIPRFQRFMKAIEPYGMKVFQQLWHGGHHYPTSWFGPPPAVSTVPSPFPKALTPPVGVPMSRGQIQEMVQAFGRAAARVREGGLHGVEIHGAHSYLVGQFLSPVTNTREDEYGGSLENRMRFLTEVYAAIREYAGQDFVVGCRLSSTDQHVGLLPGEVNQIAQKLDKLGVDYLSAGVGDYWRIESTIQGMQRPAGFNVPTADRMFEGVSAPRIVVGRFRTLEEADQVLREGHAEMIGMVRALIADPELITKTLAGSPERVRPCIACNQGCIGGIIRGGGLSCTVNPAAGFEQSLDERRIVPTASAKHIVVVGGGPGGMEAARVALTAGQRVTLFEASSKLGGAAIAAAKPAQQGSIGDFTLWLEAEVYRLGADVRLNSFADADDIRAENPDAVIIATGSTPRLDGYQLSAPDSPMVGLDQPHVFSPEDLLLRPPAKLGKTALVVDNVGHFEAIVTAIDLIQKGCAVTFITHHRAFAPYVQTTLRDDSLLEEAHRGDFTLLINHILLDVKEGTCTIRSRSGSKTTEIAADIVVVVNPNEPNRMLMEELAELPTVLIIGDAHSPRDMLQAVHEGHRAARSLA